MHIFYLHGFASSAKSSKAAFFARKLAERGRALQCPDFNEPDFSTLTISRMVEQAGRELERLGDGKVILIGSSLGAFVAVQVALKWPERISRLVLLAPAIDLRPEKLSELGDRSVEEWKASNSLTVYHFGYGRLMPLGYAFYEDAACYDAMNAVLSLPLQVFQGRRDTAVDPIVVERWCTARPNVELHLLDDDHQLIGSLEYIWAHVEPFLR